MEIKQNSVKKNPNICYAQATWVEIYESACTSQKSFNRQSYFIFQVHWNFTKKENNDKITIGERFGCTVV